MGKRFAAAAVVAGIAGGSVAGALFGVPGLSGAQEAPPATASPAQDDGAERRGDRVHPLAKALANLVERGTLTQPQADAVKAEVAAVAPDKRPGGPGPGPGGHGRPGHEFHKVALTTAAEVLGMEVEALRTELRAGKTLATVAGEKNVAVSTVIDALVAEANKRIDQAVADEKLTAEQGARAKENVEDRIAHFVNEGGRRGTEGDRRRSEPGA